MKWGNGQTGHTAGTALTSAEVAALPAKTADRAAINTYLGSLTMATSTSYTTSAPGNGSYVFENIPAGWYVVKEVTETEGQDDFTSAFMVEVVGDATANPKGSKTTVEKKVNDINDSTGEALTKKDSADHDIGDTITYTLTATLGNDLTDYQTYKLVFTDNLSKGLTYKELVSLKINGTDKSIDSVSVADGAYNGGSAAYTDGTVKTFTIADVLALGAAPGNTVEITYTCTLNENAVIGSAGNPNKVYLEYSNNPATDKLGKTEEDVNKVFTYKAIFDKYTTENEVMKHLSGAEFVLYKVKSDMSDADIAAITGSSNVDGTNILKKYTATKSAGQYEGEAEAVANSVFTFNGLDDGTYILVESVTPTGYNTIANQKYVVTATHDLDKADPELLTLTGNTQSGVIDSTGTAKADGTNTNTADIANQKGAELPETGGIGTIIFYVLGSLLVVGCGIVLISKRRMESR